MEPTNADRSTPGGRVFITGGTGFVGEYLRAALAGRPLRLLVRDPVAHADLRSPDVELVTGDVTDRENLRGTIDGCDVVIHLVAIIDESGGRTFDQTIRQGTVNVVDEAKAAGVSRFILMSALGARDDPALPYMQAKWRAEQAVIASGIPWTIFRPSVIFGPGDGFITVLAGVVRSFPVIPVVGDGKTAFQPVAAEEVADAFRTVLDDPSTAGQIYELGGGEAISYEGMLDLIAAKLGKKKPKLHMPVGLMKLIVAASKPLPRALRPPVTQAQLSMLALDNTTPNSATARLIGHPPLRLDEGIDYIKNAGR